ncbi:MAG: UDP-N-acetylmuramoyl-L-alanyl-D-glutamate--2,6-diaminopimelate ligase [Acidimicrobiia bacterium]
MLLHDLLGGVDVLERVGDLDVEIVSVTHDSRRTRPGDLFCCIRGAAVDGHRFAPEAVAAGATALLVERVLPIPVPQIRVENVRRAIGPIASHAAGDPSREMRVVGVTGTNGKTTTTHLVAEIARAAGERAEVIGTLTAERTTPEAPELQASFAQMRARGVETVAMEVSSHALAQHRVDGTHLAAVGFTNLSRDHLDFHGTLDDYFDTKARLFTPEFSAAAAVNINDSRGRELAVRAHDAGLTVRTFALGIAADVRIETIHTDAAGSTGTLVAAEGRAPIRLPLLGLFNVENAAAAAATALSAGLPFAAIAPGLAGAAPVRGRMEPIECGQPFSVLVDYAHTPDALERLVAAGRELVGGSGRVFVVFGCGGDRDRGKRREMGRVAGEGSDLVVVTSDNPRSEDPVSIATMVAEGVARTDSRAVLELDRRAAIRLAIAEAGPGDVVLIAGKGHESGQTTGTTTVPFDDRVVAREELESLAWT